MRIISVFLLLILGQIYNKSNAQSSNLLYNKIENHIRKIGFYKANMRQSIAFLDSLKAENERLEITIKQNKDLFFALTTIPEQLYVVVSDDKRFLVVSWDTQLGDSHKNFRNFVIYNIDNEYFITKSNNDDRQVAYNIVYTISRENNTPLYLLYGFGQGSARLFWQEVRLFEIKNSELISPKLFDNTLNNMHLVFDTSILEDINLPEILISNNGKEIKMPILNEDGNFEEKYRLFIFENNTFIKK